MPSNPDKLLVRMEADVGDGPVVKYFVKDLSASYRGYVKTRFLPEKLCFLFKVPVIARLLDYYDKNRMAMKVRVTMRVVITDMLKRTLSVGIFTIARTPPTIIERIFGCLCCRRKSVQRNGLVGVAVCDVLSSWFVRTGRVSSPPDRCKYRSGPVQKLTI